MKKIEHLGIAVKDIKAANKIYTDILGAEPYKEEAVTTEGVITSFFQVGESKIELLQATNSDSAIAKFIEKRGEGIHHVAFHVEDIHAAMEDLKAKGYQLINDAPKEGADNKLICFMHPKDTSGVLIELCQEKGS